MLPNSLPLLCSACGWVLHINYCSHGTFCGRRSSGRVIERSPSVRPSKHYTHKKAERNFLLRLVLLRNTEVNISALARLRDCNPCLGEGLPHESCRNVSSRNPPETCLLAPVLCLSLPLLLTFVRPSVGQWRVFLMGERALRTLCFLRMERLLPPPLSFSRIHLEQFNILGGKWSNFYNRAMPSRPILLKLREIVGL